MANPIFNTIFPNGFRLINGSVLNNWFNNPFVSIQNAITAKAGGGQTNATQISAAQTRVSVCATNGDSVKLPRSSQSVGKEYLIINDGAANLAVFPFGSSTIDGGAGAASVTLTAGRRAFFWCLADGSWQSGYMLKSA